MVRRDIIVVGASAGGIESVTELVGAVPMDLEAAIFIVIHIPAHSPSQMHHILARCTRLPVRAAVDGEAIKPGRIYVASADRHLMLDKDRVRLTRGPKENRFRPAIDVLFRSARFLLWTTDDWNHSQRHAR
jgi:two-component system, chemotaxis family, protein-glutamate methylesterase/glutaminase